ncbi:hypothetical protein AK88_00469 [Plasmodium fragile]|uniref:Uncharacterized protein n=1 Tax=Plasmodium fragile TaxID=5857 RepID=A0A0D9QU44_PLAFR|nr:uncharacterized protein AK88_00469 [Plasmodium fragile]KJP89761.1 hypothetical protein AK88_00469 [Plasmodium fragile]
MHGDIKNDIIKSLPFTFSKVELEPCDGRGQKGETKQNNKDDAPPHVVDNTQEGHTDEGSDTGGESPSEGTDHSNWYECAGGELRKDKKRKEASKGSRFNEQVNKHHSYEHVPARNGQKKNSAKKSATKWDAKSAAMSAANPLKQHPPLCAHTRGRDMISKIKERLAMGGMQKDTQGVGEGEGLHYSPDECNDRAYVNVERSKVKNWRVQNYLNVDRLSLSLSTSSMGGEGAGEEDDLSSDGESPARRVSEGGNDIFGESLFSSFNLNFDPLGGASDLVGGASDLVKRDGFFLTDAHLNTSMRDSPNRTDADQAVGKVPPVAMHNTVHSLEEDKELHLFDSLKNLYKNYDKKIKLINYTKILNTSLCKRVQDVVEGPQDKVFETSSGKDGMKDARRRKGDPSMGNKMTEQNVKAIIMNIKKRLGFYSGEERQDILNKGSKMEKRGERRMEKREEKRKEKKVRHQKRREKRYREMRENKPTFCDSLNYSRDEPLSDSVIKELCNGEEPDSLVKVDAASQNAKKWIHKGDSQNLLNYKSFISDDFNLSHDRDDFLGSSASRNSQGETFPSSSEGCASSDNDDVFALSTSSVQFKRSFLRAIGRASNEVATDREAHAEDGTQQNGAQQQDDARGDTPTNKQTEIKGQEVLKREEEVPTGTGQNCCGSVPSSGESPPKEHILLDGEQGGHSKMIFHINKESDEESDEETDEDINEDKTKELISRGDKYDQDKETCIGQSPKDFATEGQQHSTCKGSNSQRGEENESNNEVRKTEGVNILSQEMEAYMLEVFNNQVKHLNELVTSALS